MLDLKKWNNKNIYHSKEAVKNQDIIEKYFYKLYDKYKEYLYKNNQENNDSKKRLYEFINDRSEDYIKNTSKKRMIIDYMAGQTDNYFINECEYNFQEFKKHELYK